MIHVLHQAWCPSGLDCCKLNRSTNLFNLHLPQTFFILIMTRIWKINSSSKPIALTRLSYAPFLRMNSRWRVDSLPGTSRVDARSWFHPYSHGGIRTHTVRGLSSISLPIGIRGRIGQFHIGSYPGAFYSVPGEIRTLNPFGTTSSMSRVYLIPPRIQKPS